MFKRKDGMSRALVRRETIAGYLFMLPSLFFFLVFKPSAGLPQGVQGPGRPILVLPSPPPCGWSLGFMTEPRTVGLIPM